MRWFLPDGVPRPAHLPPIELTGEVGVIRGPSGAAGRLIGGTYQADEPGWVQVAGKAFHFDSYWINPTGSTPSHLLRLDARDGPELPGAEPTHRWMVPLLLRPSAGSLVWTGDERLGPNGWSVPAPPEPFRTLGLRLRGPLLTGDWESLGDGGVEALAMGLYCANYYLIPIEMQAAAWLSRPMVPPVFRAVASMSGD